MNFLGKCEMHCFCFGGIFSLGIVGCRCRDPRAMPSKWEVGVGSQTRIMLAVKTSQFGFFITDQCTLLCQMLEGKVCLSLFF